jgi:hypothetical protein
LTGAATFVSVINSPEMTSPAQIFRNLFLNLKLILQTHAKGMEIIVNQDDTYFLHYPVKGSNRGKTFAFIQVRGNYVAFYFHPFEEQPGLLADCSPELRKALQEDGRFHFGKQASTTRMMRELAEAVHAALPGKRKALQQPMLQSSFR